MSRLERNLPRPDMQVFEYYRHLVASIDFIKSDRYFQSFVDNAPDLIISGRSSHSGYGPGVTRVASSSNDTAYCKGLPQTQTAISFWSRLRHIAAVEESFRSLLGLIDKNFDKPLEENISKPYG